MKKFLYLATTLCIFASCTKPNVNARPSGSNDTTTFTYEVKLSNGSNWRGNYQDEHGQVQVTTADSLWSYTGKLPTNGYFNTYISVIPLPNNPPYGITIIGNLYQGNTLLRTDTLITSQAEQILTLQYQITP